LPHPPPKPVPVVDEKVEFKKSIENFAFDLSDKDFFFSKRESVRKIIGGSGSVVFDFEGKSYRIDWNGYWESSDWYEYQISDVHDRGGLKISGTRYID